MTKLTRCPSSPRRSRRVPLYPAIATVCVAAGILGGLGACGAAAPNPYAGPSGVRNAVPSPSGLDAGVAPEKALPAPDPEVQPRGDIAISWRDAGSGAENKDAGAAPQPKPNGGQAAPWQPGDKPSTR